MGVWVDSRIQQHCSASDNCQVALISRCMFIKEAFKECRHASSTFLLPHSSKAPALIIGQPYKSGGVGRAARALPCLHLVNGGELTPISVERSGKKKLQRCTPRVSLPSPFLFSSSFPLSVPLNGFPRSISIPIISCFPAL